MLLTMLFFTIPKQLNMLQLLGERIDVFTKLIIRQAVLRVDKSTPI